jgi:hypothetical protein
MPQAPTCCAKNFFGIGALDVQAQSLAPEYLDFKRRYEGKRRAVRRQQNGLSVSEQPVPFSIPEGTPGEPRHFHRSVFSGSLAARPGLASKIEVRSFELPS